MESRIVKIPPVAKAAGHGKEQASFTIKTNSLAIVQDENDTFLADFEGNNFAFLNMSQYFLFFLTKRMVMILWYPVVIKITHKAIP